MNTLRRGFLKMVAVAGGVLAPPGSNKYGQGMAQRRLTVEELFHHSTVDLIEVES